MCEWSNSTYVKNSVEQTLFFRERVKGNQIKPNKTNNSPANLPTCNIYLRPTDNLNQNIYERNKWLPLWMRKANEISTTGVAGDVSKKA